MCVVSKLANEERVGSKAMCRNRLRRVELLRLGARRTRSEQREACPDMGRGGGQGQKQGVDGRKVKCQQDSYARNQIDGAMMKYKGEERSFQRDGVRDFVTVSDLVRALATAKDLSSVGRVTSNNSLALLREPVYRDDDVGVEGAHHHDGGLDATSAPEARGEGWGGVREGEGGRQRAQRGKGTGER